MRTLILALPLAAAACASPGGLNPDNAVTVEAETKLAGGDSDLLPPSVMSILNGRCAKSSWVSGPLSIGGKRHPLGCDTATVAYLAKRPGYADTEVSVLQKKDDARFALAALWQAVDRVRLYAVRLGDGKSVKISGECRGRFVRPPERNFENGGMALANSPAEPGGDAVDVDAFDCTVTDLQGNMIGAISFSRR